MAYGFHSQGHITSVTVDDASVLASATYFPFGPVKGWTWGNGEPYQRTFDLDGRVNGLTLGPASATYPDLSQVFGYDSLNRLTSANLAAGQNQSFTYDANGNRTNATINAASTTYTYPGTSHRLSSLSGATTRSFTYDNAGNLASSAGITYTYDGRGRMKQAATTTYAINGLGQRVKKNGGSDIFFAYDEAGHLIGEYDSTGAPIEETVWLGDLPVAVLKPKTGGFDIFYIWTDNLGTPRQITDTLNQSRWEWANNDPFGNNAPNENPAGLGTFSYNLRFPGQYYDNEKASNYNYFRDYDPSIGRYVESDPIGLKAGPNTYAYVMSGPLVGTDKRGLWTYWGNWCGPYWTGGRRETYTPGHSYAPPVDLLDFGCMNHDICYYNCRQGHPCSASDRGDCMTACDRKLAVDSIRAGLGPAMGIVPAGLGLAMWMGTNIWPDPGDNSPNCPSCSSK